MTEEIGELKRQIMETIWKISVFDETELCESSTIIRIIDRLTEEFYQIEELATKKANKDLKSGLSGGQSFVTLFMRHSINLTASFRKKWFGERK